MAKSRSFSIFLLKEGNTAGNALKEGHVLGDAVIGASALPEGATLYILDKAPLPPWWKDYWGIQQNLKQMLKGAIVFLPVGTRCFAITFGHTFHNLEENSYEYDFGLRTTLNALDPQKIKSTDILQPENARRERIQSPTSSDITFFDFNRDESIVKKLTGSVKEEYKNFLTNITGASSLKVSSKVTANEISELCEKLLKIYKKDDYKKSFPELHNIVPVKDPSVLDQLNDKLVDAFNDMAIELVLTIPELIDHNGSFQIKYSGVGRTQAVFDDVYILHYREYLTEKNIQDVSLEIFRKHKLRIQDENGNTKQSYTIFKCFIFDCELDTQHYHLCEGEWYCINKDYIQRIKNELDPSFVDSDILTECLQKREDEFNLYIASENDDVICLDKKNIAPKGQTQVEPCDLLTMNESIVLLIHIKISTRSSALSHLFNQGLNSVELLRLNDESKQKLKDLTTDISFHSSIDNDDFAVVYGIVTAKENSNKSDNLPIFSRISLMRALRALKLMGIQGSVVFIEDKVDRKSTTQEPTNASPHS